MLGKGRSKASKGFQCSSLKSRFIIKGGGGKQLTDLSNFSGALGDNESDY